MTECAPGCGACCDPVVLAFRPEDMVGPSAAFAREHWTVIDEVTRGSGTYYRIHCDVFDQATRRCTAYEQRPPICANYPAYGEPLAPGHRKADGLPLVCAFQADVRTVLPLVAVTHGR